MLGEMARFNSDFICKAANLKSPQAASRGALTAGSHNTAVFIHSCDCVQPRESRRKFVFALMTHLLEDANLKVKGDLLTMQCIL